MASLLKASRAEFSHQYFLVAAETCLQIFRFEIGAFRSVSVFQTSFDDSKDYRTRRTGNSGEFLVCAEIDFGRFLHFFRIF